MKLQTKFTLTLLFSSAFTAALVGGVAYWLLMSDFSNSIREEAFDNFRSDVEVYLDYYGSWQEAVRHEAFPEFVRRYRSTVRQHIRPQNMPPTGLGPQHMSAPSSEQAKEWAKPRGENSVFARQNQAPFLFLLANTAGVIVKGQPDYPLGEKLNSSLLAQAMPIYHAGKMVLQAIPIGTPNLTPEDQSYLKALRHALLWGMIAAALLASLLGLLIGWRISRSINLLTDAVSSFESGGELPAEVPVRSRDEIGQLTHAFNHMSSQLVRSHQELHEASIRDPLTHLHNRRYFTDQAETLYQQAQRYNTPLAVILADLDHVKQINDNFSHQVGDQVLKRTAEILQRNIRRGDLLARYGGEEFVIVFPHSTMEQAFKRCDALRNEIEADPLWQQINSNLSVTMSLGICDAVDAGGLTQMLSLADEQLYEAKRGGRNCIYPQAA